MVKVKNVIFRNYDDICNMAKPRPEQGLEIANHRGINNEGYVSITGTKQQINHYLQDYPLISDRLRTLNNIPKFRIINTTKERIY